MWAQTKAEDWMNVGWALLNLNLTNLVFFTFNKNFAQTNTNRDVLHRERRCRALSGSDKTKFDSSYLLKPDARPKRGCNVWVMRGPEFHVRGAGAGGGRFLTTAPRVLVRVRGSLQPIKLTTHTLTAVWIPHLAVVSHPSKINEQTQFSFSFAAKTMRTLQITAHRPPHVAKRNADECSERIEDQKSPSHGRQARVRTPLQAVCHLGLGPLSAGWKIPIVSWKISLLSLRHKKGAIHSIKKKPFLRVTFLFRRGRGRFLFRGQDSSQGLRQLSRVRPLNYD